MSPLVTARPVAGAPRAFAFPEVRHLDLPGVRVRGVHVPGRTKLRLLVVADAGAAAEPRDRLGVAHLAGEVMPRGAAGLGELDLAIAFERLGTSPGTSVGYDTARATVGVPVGLAQPAAELLAELVRRPTLRLEDIADTRRAAVEDDRASLTTPEAVVSRVVRRMVWSPDSRYAEAASGTAETLARIEDADVVDFHRRRWQDQDLIVVAVGDLTDVDLDAIGQPFVGGSSADRSGVAALPGNQTRTVVLGDRPDAAQSVLLFSRPGPARGEPDAAALDIALAAAFGAFGSRLNLRMREELGYTYGARGGVTRRRNAGVFTASMSVRTEVTADAVREALGVIDRVLDEGLADDEVDRARDNLVRRYPVQFDGNSAIAGAVADLLTHDLPDDFHDRRLALFLSTTTAEANAALRRAVRTDDLVIGVAGNATVVEGPLADLGLGEVVRRQP